MLRKTFDPSWLLALVLALFSGLGVAQAPVEGKHYQRLKNPVAVETGKKIEVIEFFSYGCPHCAAFEPYIGPWSKKLPADVQFRRVPALFQTPWVNLAKIYFTLDTLGVEDKLGQSVFDALHKEHLPLQQEAAFMDWAAKKGLDRDKVASVFTSFSVNSNINRARSIATTYRIQGVPLLVIDGKFMADVDMAGGFEQLLKLTDHLVAKARQERGKS
ncbi:Thiol:disulfide interchange protein DsbA [Burkholderiales bacterium]|nr:MAG: thiol:disulfide interchange protein DsbA/DsbL [Burkholderiales bacterium]CAG0991378.1 Thiol:disulfide interchange protein DsbA [Burkholderiales bacterium]